MKNELPDGWEWKPLGSICEIIGGKPNPKGEEPFKCGKIPFVKMKDLGKYHLTTNLDETETSLNEDFVSESNFRIIKKGAILIPRSGSVALNHRAVLGVDACIVSHICALELKDLNIDEFYLYYALTTIDMRKYMKKTTGLDLITFQDLTKINIPIPTPEIQRKIVTILKKAEETKKLRIQADKLTQQLLESVFLEMFGDPVTNPKGWDTIELGSLIEFLTSGSRGWAKYYAEDGEKFIRIQNVKNGILDFSDVQFVKPPKTMEATRTKVKEGDLLISITADLGRTAVIDKKTAAEGAYINQHLALVRLNQEFFNPVFVSEYLKSEGGNRQFAFLDQKGVKSGLNFKAIKSLKVFLPPLELQQEFESIYTHIKKINQHQIQANVRIDDLFKILMQKAFNGELVS